MRIRSQRNPVVRKWARSESWAFSSLPNRLPGSSWATKFTFMEPTSVSAATGGNGSIGNGFVSATPCPVATPPRTPARSVATVTARLAALCSQEMFTVSIAGSITDALRASRTEANSS